MGIAKLKFFRWGLVLVYIGGGCFSIYGTPAEAANWQLFGTNESTGINLYYDTESIEYPVKGLVKVWVKSVPLDEKGRHKRIREREKVTNKNYQNFGYTLLLYEMNCAEQKYHITAVIDYEKDGQVIQSARYTADKWNLVPAESMVGFLYMEVLCP